ncbi:DUF362 domain-containing protein [Anaeromassilibacillus sp. An200]|uniref:DUF362 domain-containing protein n=1 Tax=Anaeromassilibacillus sp. An200 TaxID=1965587 RepID=UPI000B39316E|nr:DUF362 domain-containing protein [Anaeromassilibacillus sp. An200]OUP12916.1 hypothetical protein B5F35_06530 [Anaeromassilibacillus sp. An200]
MREPVEVCVSACEAYEYEKVRAVLAEQFRLLKADEVIRPGMRVAVKPNLVTRSTPDESAVTHPVVICAVVSLLKEMGASVVIAESPGGPYTPSLLKGIYEQSGCAQAEQYGAELNLDCTWGELKAPEARLCRSFSVITPLLEADAIVDVCKLKTHCMMGMSAAVKNLFGSVPGLMKPELHCRFPEKEPFGTMIADLCQALHPVLSVVDAVTAMEGNGPTGGQPRHVGALLASRSPYAVDLACTTIIGMDPESVYPLRSAMDRGLCPRTADDLVWLCEPASQFAVADFLQPESKSADFITRLPKFLQPLAARLATPSPKIRTAECIGCGKCAESCPQHTITIRNRKAVIDYTNCIRCYCCHEMCPKHVIDIRRLSLFRH